MDINVSQKGYSRKLKAVDVFITSEQITVPFLYPGCIANIEMRKSGKTDTSYFTKLMITEVSHEVDAKEVITVVILRLLLQIQVLFQDQNLKCQNLRHR